jgi:hypothetical protein
MWTEAELARWIANARNYQFLMRLSSEREMRPFPDVARAVGAALAQFETEAAEDIAKSKKPLLLEAQPC